MSQAIAVCHGEFGRAALYSLNKAIITHAHREGHLIFHVDGAPASVPVSDQIVDIAPGRAAAISPWEPHGFELEGDDSNICLVLYIKPMWFLENSTSAEFALKFGRSELMLTEELRNLVNRLTSLLLDDEDPIGFDQLLYAVTRESFDLSWRNDIEALRKESYSRFSDFRVRRSLRLIQEKMGQEMDMEDMARSVGLSRPHFFKLFKQYMGVTPNVYMNTLRSERAIEELLHTEKTVTDIAFDLGFSSQASFTRFFSSNVGIAPSEYRRVAHVTDGAFPMM